MRVPDFFIFCLWSKAYKIVVTRATCGTRKLKEKTVNILYSCIALLAFSHTSMEDNGKSLDRVM